MKKVFLDANIILDLLDSNRISHMASKKVFEKLIDQDWQIVISEDLLTTIYYIVKNKQVVLEFFEMIIEQWDIVAFGKKSIIKAIVICKNNPSLDFEDVIQSLSAKISICNLIITNDNGFYDCGIPIKSSKEFIEIV